MSDLHSTTSIEKTLASVSSYDQDDQSKKSMQSHDQNEFDDDYKGHGEDDDDDDEEDASVERAFSIVSFSLHRRPSVDSAFTVPTISGGGSKTRAASVALTTNGDATSGLSYDCKHDPSRLEAADSDLKLKAEEDVYPDGGLQAWMMVLGVRDITYHSLVWAYLRPGDVEHIFDVSLVQSSPRFALSGHRGQGQLDNDNRTVPASRLYRFPWTGGPPL